MFTIKKKGFTLIELLAVIVILAIIALVTIPIVMNMINVARKKAAESATYGYVDAIDYNLSLTEYEELSFNKKSYSMMLRIKNIKLDNNNSYNFHLDNNTEYTVEEIKTAGLKMKGKHPTSGTVYIGNKRVESATICIEGYTVTYNNKNAEATTKCGDESSSSTTYTAYNPGDLIEYDPVANVSCSSGSTCYKWRVITVGDTESSDKITLLMDHNLLKSEWASYDDSDNFDAESAGISMTGPITALKALETETSGWNNALKLTYTYDTDYDDGYEKSYSYNYGKLSCASGACKFENGQNFTSNLKARMITVEEVSSLVKNAGADSESEAYKWNSLYADTFYFSSKTYQLGSKDLEAATGTPSASQELKWLIENTYEDSDSGATDNNYGDNTDDYWTLTPYSYDSAFALYCRGNLLSDSSSNEKGVRPVITISKSVLSS